MIKLEVFGHTGEGNIKSRIGCIENKLGVDIIIRVSYPADTLLQ
jgi:hypothetical protein